MNAGSLNRQISIEKKSIFQDPVYGTEMVVWVPLSALDEGAFDPGTFSGDAFDVSPAEKFWAEIVDVPPSRSEAVTMGLSVARNQTRIRIRWRGDITSDMRVTVHGDTDVVYQIVGGPAEIGGRKDGLELVLERYSS
jgi:head-tail adaptor